MIVSLSPIPKLGSMLGVEPALKEKKKDSSLLSVSGLLFLQLSNLLSHPHGSSVPPSLSCPLLGFIIFSWDYHHLICNYFVCVCVVCLLHKMHAPGVKRLFSAESLWYVEYRRQPINICGLNENWACDQLQLLEPFSWNAVRLSLFPFFAGNNLFF